MFRVNERSMVAVGSATTATPRNLPASPGFHAETTDDPHQGAQQAPQVPWVL